MRAPTALLAETAPSAPTGSPSNGPASGRPFDPFDFAVQLRSDWNMMRRAFNESRRICQRSSGRESRSKPSRTPQSDGRTFFTRFYWTAKSCLRDP